MKTLKQEWQNIIIAVEMVVLGILLCLLVESLLIRAGGTQTGAESSVCEKPRIAAVYPAATNAIADTSETPADTSLSGMAPIGDTSSVSSDTSDITANEQRRYLEVPLSVELQDYIYDLCDSYDVPFELVVAVIDAESSFQTGAVSANCYGLMQINEIGHTELSEKLGIQNFLDPYQNVHAGIYVLSQALQATDGDVVAALMRYNCGPTGARRLWDKGVHSTAYTDKVMRLYNGYKETK